MTSATRPAAIAATALSLTALAVAAFLFLDTTRSRPTAGFWRVTSYGHDCARDPTWREREPRTLVPEPFHGELLHLPTSTRVAPTDHRCDVYRGYLVVREPSRLSLELHANGHTRVVFGKAELVSLDSGSVRITRRVERPLAAGSHLLEVRSDHEGQLAYVRLSALVEPESTATATPLSARALPPLDHDTLAPSLADADAVRADPGFVRRSGLRLVVFLAALWLALLGPRLARRLEALRANRTLDAVVLASGALVSIVVIELWRVLPSAVVDPHHVAHGARAWRTLWLGIPTRSIVDSIPAMGPTAWSAGAAFALGAEQGPRVLAVAVGALSAALVVGAAALTRGARGGAVALAATTLLAFARGPARLDDASLAGLGLAALACALAWLWARTRVGTWLARAVRSRDASDPARSMRTSRERRTLPLALACLVLALGALSLGLGPLAAAPVAVLALALGLDTVAGLAT
jgi:hypothetical protein